MNRRVTWSRNSDAKSSKATKVVFPPRAKMFRNERRVWALAQQEKEAARSRSSSQTIVARRPAILASCFESRAWIEKKKKKKTPGRHNKSKKKHLCRSKGAALNQRTALHCVPFVRLTFRLPAIVLRRAVTVTARFSRRERQQSCPPFFLSP